METSFYTENELKRLGIGKIGDNVLISKKASIYNAQDLKIGNNVRIDDFCILSGKITLGNYIHISAYTALFGGRKQGIIVEDYATISARCEIYALTDDYSGNSMTNPMVPEKYRNVYEARVRIEKYVIIGAGCTVLPGVTIGEGTAIGAMSLVNKEVDKWGIYVGIPCKKIRERSRELEKKVMLFENCNR